MGIGGKGNLKNGRLAKSNLGGAVLTSEAAAKEDGGLDWVADIPTMQRHPVEL